MRWADLDFDEGLWTLSDNKTDTPVVLPLSVLALNILQRRAEDNDSEWVLPSRPSHVRNLYPALEKLRKWVGTDDFVIHD